MVSFLQIPPPKPCTKASSLLYVPHAPPISPSTIWSFWWYVVSSTNNEAPLCAFFASLLLLPPSYVKISSSATSSRVPPFDAFPLISGTMTPSTRNRKLQAFTIQLGSCDCLYAGVVPNNPSNSQVLYRGADKSLARPGRKQTTATEDFEFHISYL